jgi:hypothetical protein
MKEMTSCQGGSSSRLKFKEFSRHRQKQVI